MKNDFDVSDSFADFVDELTTDDKNSNHRLSTSKRERFEPNLTLN